MTFRGLLNIKNAGLLASFFQSFVIMGNIDIDAKMLHENVVTRSGRIVNPQIRGDSSVT